MPFSFQNRLCLEVVLKVHGTFDVFTKVNSIAHGELHDDDATCICFGFLPASLVKTFKTACPDPMISCVQRYGGTGFDSGKMI